MSDISTWPTAFYSAGLCLKHVFNSYSPKLLSRCQFSFVCFRPSASGLVSDNFRRLDMKHRSYRRQGAGTSGSKHKRRNWRELKKSRGEHGHQSSWCGRGRAGSNKKLDVCYKCGEEGHWAKNCAQKGRNKARVW